MNQDKKAPDETENSHIEVGIGINGFTFKGSLKLFFKLLKYVLIIGTSFVVIAVILFYKNGHLGQLFDPKAAYIESKKKILTDAYPNIKKIIDSYDEYLGYSPLTQSKDSRIETDGLKFLNNNIGSARDLFEATTPYDFDYVFKLWVWHHQALIYLIHGDIKKDQRSILTALYSINKATDMLEKELSENLFKDSESGSRLRELNTKVQRDKFVILVFSYIYVGKDEYMKEALLILDDFGGCDYLLKQNMLHRDIYRTVGCHNSVHSNGMH